MFHIYLKQYFCNKIKSVQDRKKSFEFINSSARKYKFVKLLYIQILLKNQNTEKKGNKVSVTILIFISYTVNKQREQPS